MTDPPLSQKMPILSTLPQILWKYLW